MRGSDPAPVALFVHRRPRHAAEVLAGLRRDGVRSVYVFSDGPASAAEEGLVEETRNRIRAERGIAIELIEREENLGLAQAITRGVSDVLRDHDSVIVLEDDCVPLPGFHDFLQRGLARYAAANDVACISGYGPPRVRRPWGYRAHGYFTERISSWGWGTWKRAWSFLDSDWPSLRRRIEAAVPDLTAAGPDLEQWLHPDSDLRVGREVWTPLWQFPLLLEHKKTLWPFRSYVRNIGFDATAVNCGPRSIEHTRGAPVPPARFRFPGRMTVVPAITRPFTSSIALQRHHRFERLRRAVARVGPVRESYRALRRVLARLRE